jgi:hypothetical protein
MDGSDKMKRIYGRRPKIKMHRKMCITAQFFVHAD